MISISILWAVPLERISDFGENPGHLRMFLYLPKKAKTQAELPLIVTLHGSWLSAKALSNSCGINKLADSLGFVICYPDQPLYNNLLTAFTFYSPNKMKKGQGETASVKQMIDYCIEHYPINKDKIFIWGFSAGAAMTNVMLNAYPDIFAAGAMLAPPSQLHEGINPNRDIKPRIAIIQGTKDPTVPPHHAQKVFEQWENFLEFEPSQRVIEKNYRNLPQLQLTHYKNDPHHFLIKLDIEGMKHKIPVNPGESIKQGGKKAIYTTDFDFHLAYWVCEFFGLI